MLSSKEHQRINQAVYIATKQEFMKKIAVLVAAVLLAVTASAQGKFGITAGMNFNSAKIQDIELDSRMGWSAGITYAFDLPLGFSIQPSLVYTQRGLQIDASNLEISRTVGSLNLPVSVQWGPDLLVARPFIDVTPYVGYSLMNKAKAEAAGLTSDVKGKNSFEYGLGLGAGLNVWKIQAIIRYNWNFGTLGSLKDFTEVDLGGLTSDSKNYGGISLHLAFFF